MAYVMNYTPLRGNLQHPSLYLVILLRSDVMWDLNNILGVCSQVSQDIGQCVIVITDKNNYILSPYPVPGLCLILEIEQEIKKRAV